MIFLNHFSTFLKIETKRKHKHEKKLKERKNMGTCTSSRQTQVSFATWAWPNEGDAADDASAGIVLVDISTSKSYLPLTATISWSGPISHYKF